ncbi:sulfatase-like hydrolase/transferase [Erythrobacter rubeus]|uniref:Sulfatase-like hydrolase/transferase n=1 Tax=Erythrobacter rubeus TaxID=2760803 RepID=A0ABR8KVL4_9SPHN|nr:sulfatase-like hydrolase/transferase [Erythrobacter rubeus]MBD2842449.1 sulfatase-like hydrolase/transferase [Erythrobacter rubeus]
MAEAAMQSDRSGLRWTPVQPGEWRAFANWLLVWVVFANGGFALMYFVGSPPRFPEIIAFAAVGLLLRDQRYLLQCAGFLVVMTYSVLSFIAGLFNLSIVSLTYSLSFLIELDVTESKEYMLGGGLLLFLVMAALRRMREKTNFQDLRITILTVCLAGAFALFDFQLSMGMRGHYNRAASAETPFTSALIQSGIVPETGPLERNLLVVMVESLGLPVENEEMKRLLFLRYDSEAVRSRFEVTTGETTYFSSTTAGEIRELCSRWGEYHSLVDQGDSTCLPARLASHGVETTAYHSFDGEFFDRSSWYPNVGFENSYFRKDLLKRGSRPCGGVFPGVCDRDVPSELAQRLKSSDTPQFIYWLTVNSHLPVPLQNNLGVDDCHRVSTILAEQYPMICRQFAIWDAIDEAIIREASALDFPPTDILIVGDHMPPYFDRQNRRQFAPDRVPWILLKWRDEVAKD